MDELPMVVDLARQIRIVLVGRLEDHLEPSLVMQYGRGRGRGAHLGAIGEFVGCEVHLAKGTLPYQLPQVVIAHILQVLVGKLAVDHIVSAIRRPQWQRLAGRAGEEEAAYSRSSWYELASYRQMMHVSSLHCNHQQRTTNLGLPSQRLGPSFACLHILLSFLRLAQPLLPASPTSARGPRVSMRFAMRKGGRFVFGMSGLVWSGLVRSGLGGEGLQTGHRYRSSPVAGRRLAPKLAVVFMNRVAGFGGGPTGGGRRGEEKGGGEDDGLRSAGFRVVASRGQRVLTLDRAVVVVSQKT